MTGVFGKLRGDEHCESHDSNPAREAGHELSSRKQEEDKHEQSNSEVDQACGRHLPEGGSRRDGGHRAERAKRHEHERDEERHAVVGPAPDDQGADPQTYHDGGKREGDAVGGVVAEREANPFEHTCLRRRE